MLSSLSFSEPLEYYFSEEVKSYRKWYLYLFSTLLAQGVWLLPDVTTSKSAGLRGQRLAAVVTINLLWGRALETVTISGNDCHHLSVAAPISLGQAEGH